MPKSTFTRDSDLLRQLLIDARKARGLTQAALACLLARPQSFVSKYEQGERRLDLIEFLQVTDAIGVDPCRLIRRLRPAPRAVLQ